MPGINGLNQYSNLICMPTTMATSVQVLSKRKPYLKPHLQLEPRGFLEGFFEGVPHGVPRLQELGYLRNTESDIYIFSRT